MLETVQERFELLSKREKLMVFLTLIAVFWVLLGHLILEPSLSKKTKLKQQLFSAQSQASASKLAAIQTEALRKKDPNLNNRRQLKAIKNQLRELKQQINHGEKKIVSPQQMATVLRDMLDKHHRLKLVNLETLSTKPIAKVEHNQSIFRHGLAMTLSGRYFDVYHYLEALESLPWRFYWDSIDYQVKEYPTAEVTLHIYTLSFQEDWLGI
jgi:MSHA biogenesis protein MshJ